MSTKTITCLNGKFVDSDQAVVSVADRGFRFGDGVFETIRLENGVPYQWEGHLERLGQGLAALHIPSPTEHWQLAARTVVARNHASDGFLRIAVSRGVGSLGYLPMDNLTPTWAIEYLPASPSPAIPSKLWLTEITRAPLSCLPANHKLAQGVTSTLALLEARRHGCEEALMLTTDGKLCET